MKEFIRKWILSSIVVIVIVFGWNYPLLGFSVPIVMITAIFFGLFRNRYFCGNLCPRGSFFDHWIFPLSKKKPLPRWLFSWTFRILVLVFLMGLMLFRLWQSENLASVGHLFWFMCVATTFIGIILGFGIHPRTWCSFCPIGTLQKMLSRKKFFLTLDQEKCKSCRICEKKCPLQLRIVGHENMEILASDCLRCKKCIHVCPTKALREK